MRNVLKLIGWGFMLSKKNRYAIIDIGTNTCLLLIAEFQDGKVITITERQEIPRLGKDVDSQKNISRDAFERVLSVLKSIYGNF